MLGLPASTHHPNLDVGRLQGRRPQGGVGLGLIDPELLGETRAAALYELREAVEVQGSAEANGGSAHHCREDLEHVLHGAAYDSCRSWFLL